MILVLLSLISGNVFSQNYSPSSQYKDVTRVEVHSKILDEDREFYVYTPKGGSNENFTVIYLLDGEMHRPYGEVLKFAKSKPHIVIGVETHNHRNRDMTPCVTSLRQYSGGADKFLQFLSEELMLFVDANYNTTGNNILLGASNAGLFTIYAMLAKPESFFAYISSSATVGYCSDLLKEMIVKLKTTSRLDNKFLYLTYGLKNEMPLVTETLPEFTDYLKTQLQNLRIEYKPVSNEGHVPKSGFTNGLKSIYK